MSTLDLPTNATEPAGHVPAGEVRVWDPLVRALHWSLVAAVAVAFVTGDESEKIHVYAGYAALAIVGLRLVWGVVGTRHARFADFVRGPRAVLAHLRDMARLQPGRHLGHNPAAGAMVIALLVTILLTGLSGWVALGPGALAHAAEDIHEVVANLLLGLVILHILGVIVSSVLERQNLVRAMWTGRKRL